MHKGLPMVAFVTVFPTFHLANARLTLPILPPQTLPLSFGLNDQKADLERAGGSISDVDSNTGRRKRKKRSRQRSQLVPKETPNGENDAREESPIRLRMSTGDSKSLSRPRKRRRKTDCVQLDLDGSRMIQPGKVRTGRKGKVKEPSWTKVRQAEDGFHKHAVGESSLDARWPIKNLKRNGIGGNVGGYKVVGSGGSLWQPPGRLKRELEELVNPSSKCEDIRGGVSAEASAAKFKTQASTASSAMRTPNSGQKPRRKDSLSLVPRDRSIAEASKAVLISPPFEKSRGRTAGSFNATPPRRPGLKRALSTDSGGVALAGRMSTANGGTARYRRESSFDSSIFSKAATASAPRPAATAPLRPPLTAAPRHTTRDPPRPAWTPTARPAATASSRPVATAAPRSIATAGPRRPVTTSSGFDEVSSLVAKALMPLKSGPTFVAGTVTSRSRPAGHSRGYEKTSFPGVVQSVSNRKFFLWANDKLFDGKAYDR